MIKVLNKKTDQIPEGALYVGRPSPLGNPFVINKDGDRADVIAMYEIYAYLCLDLQEFVDELLKIPRATALVCWCRPLPCHADLLSEFHLNFATLPRDRITTTRSRGQDQEGLGQVPSGDQVSAPAERRSHSVSSEA